MEEQQVLQVLVQEAQEEIGKLRAELYSTRRLAEERRQALDSMTVARDQLAGIAQQLEGQVQLMQQKVIQLPQLQQELQALHDLHQRLQKDSQVQLQARRILEQELSDERAARSTAEESRAKAEAERSRLQLARDDLAAQLRIARQKAADAEEEQLRAEEEAVLLRRELGLVQTQGTAPNAAGATGLAADGGAAAAELEAQRMQVASLVQELQHVQADAAAAKAQVSKLQLQLTQARQQQQQQLHQQQQQQQQHQPAAGELAALQAKVLGLESELSAARGQITNLQVELATAQATAHLQSAGIDGSQAGTAAAAVVGGGDDEAALQEQVELLMGKLITLKKSRDKLLAQMDRQSIEQEQLAAENQALAASATQAQEEREKWQAQAQDALATIARLQELMEESAAWEAAAAGPAGMPGGNSSSNQTAEAPDAAQAQQSNVSSSSAGAAEDASVADAGSGNAPGDGGAMQLHAALVKERSRSAALDMQVRLLSAQLLRVFAAHHGASRALVPLLGAAEAKLLQLKVQGGR